MYTLSFDLGSMKYFSKSDEIRLPSAGLVRTYFCNVKDESGKWYFSGTSGGELCVFDMDNKLFKASVQVGTTSITTLAMVQGQLLAGLSNGHFFKLQGKECVWNVVGKLELQCAILNITSNNQTGTVFVGTEDCTIYFVDVKNWKVSVFSSGHSGPIVDMAIKGDSNGGHFASIDSQGTAIVWQKQGNQNVMLNSFSPYNKQDVNGSTIALGDNNKVVTGWSNGNVKCFPIDSNTISPKQEWEIPTAHKCPVTA